ncbi:MAG TPA: zinc ribbon domain-containing protein [Candidatus Ozemobacteraceae bacterium]|nr:zinc ribbon domain-containing protein [Candidatus Ozemobacteraceae bacterium]
MPIYEYRCDECRKTFSVLCRISELAEHPACEKCSSTRTRRLISRFKTVRSEAQLLESMADPASLSGLDENDPRSIARWAKKMAREMGEDMGDEIEAMAEEEISKAGKGKGSTEQGDDVAMPSSTSMPPMPASDEE